MGRWVFCTPLTPCHAPAHKTKNKKGHPDSKSKSKCMYLKYRCITLPKKPILLANIVLLFLLDIAVLFSTMENISGKEAPPHIFYSQNKTLNLSHLNNFFYMYIHSECIPKTSWYYKLKGTIKLPYST